MGWWQDKLAGREPTTAPVPPAPMYQPPAQQVPQQPYPQQPYPQQPYPQQAYAPQPVPGYPAQPYPPGQVAAAQPQQYFDPSTGQPLAPGQLPAGVALQQWQGGQGVRDAQQCPSCGGYNLFSRQNVDGMPSRLPPPMPQCADCGYPVVQFGSKTGAGGDLQTTQQGNPNAAPPRPARESKSGVVVTEQGALQTGWHPDVVVARVTAR